MSTRDSFASAVTLVGALAALGAISCGTDSTPTDSMAEPLREFRYDCGSGTGTKVSTASLSGTMIALDTGAGMRLVDPVSGDVTHLAGYTFQSWSPDGSLIAAGRDSEVALFERSLGAPLAVLPTKTISWDPHNRRVGYLEDPEFVVLDLDSGGTSRHHVCPDQSDIPDGVRKGCIAVEWSRTLDRLLVRSVEHYSGRTLLTNLDGEVFGTLPGGSWSPDGRFLLLSAGTEYDQNFEVYDVAAGASVLYQGAAVTVPGEFFARRWEGPCHLTMVSDYQTRKSRVTFNICEGARIEPQPEGLLREIAWWSDDGRWMTYITSADSAGTQHLVVFDPTSATQDTICQVSNAGDGRGEFRLNRFPWSRSGDFMLVAITDTIDHAERVALLSRDGEIVRWLSDVDGDAHWSR